MIVVDFNQVDNAVLSFFCNGGLTSLCLKNLVLL